jgi:hypothetical protein
VFLSVYGSCVLGIHGVCVRIVGPSVYTWGCRGVGVSQDSSYQTSTRFCAVMTSRAVRDSH